MCAFGINGNWLVSRVLCDMWCESWCVAVTCGVCVCVMWCVCAQRLGFGRLLVNSPRLAILDEASSALDLESEKVLLLPSPPPSPPTSLSHIPRHQVDDRDSPTTSAPLDGACKLLLRKTFMRGVGAGNV